MIRATKAETAAVVAGIEPMLTHRPARSEGTTNAILVQTQHRSDQEERARSR